MPRIGDKAPEFKAITTQGEINFPADSSGSWVIHFSQSREISTKAVRAFQIKIKVVWITTFFIISFLSANN